MMEQKKVEIYIDEDFLNSVPRPSKEQYEALKQSIKKDGLLQPIQVASDGKILDGHTRYDICQELDIPAKYVIKDIPEDKQKMYAVTVNLKRRHLSDFQIVELLEHELYNIKAEARALGYSSLGGTGAKKKNKRGDLPREERSPFAEVSQRIGVGAIRIEKILRVKQHGSKQLIEDVRNEKVSLERATKIIEAERGLKPRYNFEKKRIKIEKVFKYCPVCGTKTLESWYDVKEIHCTKCDMYYTLSRRKH